MTGLMQRRYRQMKIKPVKTEKDYKSVLEVIRNLWDADPNTPEGDTLEVLITLIEAYEEKHYHIDPPDPVEAIKFRMEQKGLRKIDLAHIMGGKNRVSEVLSRKKPLTLRMIRNLHNEMGIPYESLVGFTSPILQSGPDRTIQDTDLTPGPRRFLFDRMKEAA
jgi:HTH-type transcriptional regulator / antitoxin HigA